MTPAMYTILFGKIERVAQRFGWALALHGSMLNDCDIILTPWTEDAEVDHKVIIEAMKNAILENFGDEASVNFKPTVKPHGRLAYIIMLDYNKHYFDISVVDTRLSKHTEYKE